MLRLPEVNELAKESKFGSLGIGIWSLFVFWDLMLGILYE
jgi:hypothetical protein